MILYCCDIPVCLMVMMLHKQSVNNDKEAILFIDKDIYAKRNIFYEDIERSGCFSKVIPCNMFEGMRQHRLPPEELEQHIINHYDNTFAENGYTIDNFNDIYVVNDSWDGDINLYFTLKRKIYYWVETVKNLAIYLKPTESLSNLSNYNFLLKKYKTFTPESEYSIPILNNLSEESQKHFNNKQFLIWNYQDAVNMINNDAICKMLNCWKLIDISYIDFSGVCLLRNSLGHIYSVHFVRIDTLSQRFYSNAGTYTHQDIVSIIDKTALDYYFPESKVYVKPHPNDPMDDEQAKLLISEDATVIGSVPVEILGRYFQIKNVKFKYALGYNSTSTAFIDCISHNQLLLGAEFYRTYHFYGSLFTALEFGARNLPEINTFYCTPILETQCKFLLHTITNTSYIVRGSGNYNFLPNSFYIVSDLPSDLGAALRYKLKTLISSTTLCLIDTTEKYTFIDEELYEFLVPIRINKTKLKEDTLDPCRIEMIWIFSKNAKIREAARNFSTEKILPRLGVKLSVTKLSTVEIINCFKEAEKSKLAENLQNITERFNSLYDAIMNSGSEDMLGILMRSETDLSRYLDSLKMLSKRYLLIVAVRDTPGNFLSSDILEKYYNIGFCKLTNKLWQTYIGVMFRGKLLFETIGENEEPSYYNYESMTNDFSLSVTSKAWRKGNVAEIKINGVDYSVNMRGLNIVIYDTEDGGIIDSVAFDLHDSKFRCIHKTFGDAEK